MPDQPLTFAALLVPAGIVVAGALITGLIEVLKTAIPWLDEHVSGALMALVISLVLYILAGIATNANTLDLALGVFAAWLACAMASIGIKAGTAHANTVIQSK